MHRRIQRLLALFLLCSAAVNSGFWLKSVWGQPRRSSVTRSGSPSPVKQVARSINADLKSMRVFIGTYSQRGSRGIYRSQLDLGTGKLAEPVAVAELKNASFVALHPSGRFLYAVSETEDYQGQKSGSLAAYKVSAEGTLMKLSERPSGGGAPCHVAVDRSGRVLLAANYSGGSVAAFKIDDDGSLAESGQTIQHRGSSANPQRQEGPHAHSVTISPDNRFVIAADLGLDKLFVYRLGRDPLLTPNDGNPELKLKPGAGPRHFAFHPDGRRAFVINELDSTIAALDYDPQRGELTVKSAVSTLPADFKGENSTADIHVHPSGKWVYGSNRGHDTIACYSVDAQTGGLKLLGHEPAGGRAPRNFAIDPTGAFLLAASQDSDRIRVFRIDPDSGKLVRTGDDVQVPMPVCIVFDERAGEDAK